MGIKLDNLKQCITNAKVELECGGKYDWNENIEQCNRWLDLALQYVEDLK